MSGEELQRAIEAAIEAKVGNPLNALTNEVKRQNGRITSLERRADQMDARWDAHDHWTPEEKEAVLRGISEIDRQITKSLRREMERMRTETDAMRWRQLQSVGWRLAIGLVIGIPSSTAFLGWILERFG